MSRDEGWLERVGKQAHDELMTWPDWKLKAMNLEYMVKEKETKKMNELKQQGFTISQRVPLENVRNLLVSALEGGSDYWIDCVSYDYGQGRVKADFQGGGEFGVYDETLKEMWSPKYVLPFTVGSKLIVSVQDDKKDYCLDLDSVQRGLQLMFDKYPNHFNDLVNENDDAETADVWLQLALFGELIYG